MLFARRLITTALALLGLFLGYKSLPTAPAKLRVRETYAVDLLGMHRLIAEHFHIQIEATWRDQIFLEPDVPQHPFRHFSVAAVRIENIGEQALEWERDVVEPLIFSIQGDGEIVTRTGRVDRKQPQSLSTEATLSADRKQLAWSAPFMPSGGYVEFEIYHTGEPEDLHVNGRLARQEQLSLQRRDVAPTFWRSSTVSAILRFSTILSLLLFVAALLVRLHLFGTPFFLQALHASASSFSPVALATFGIGLPMALAYPRNATAVEPIVAQAIACLLFVPLFIRYTLRGREIIAFVAGLRR